MYSPVYVGVEKPRAARSIAPVRGSTASKVTDGQLLPRMFAACRSTLGSDDSPLVGGARATAAARFMTWPITATKVGNAPIQLRLEVQPYFIAVFPVSHRIQ